jgi:hypothetical protein
MDQTWKYIGEYYSGRITYTINSQKTPIQAFALATRYSPFGYLYSKEADLSYLSYQFLKETYNMIEKPITHSLTRFLWRQWEKGSIFNYYEELRRNLTSNTVNLPLKPKIGVLLAKTQNYPLQVNNVPSLYLNSNIFWQISGNETISKEIVEVLT